MGLSAKNMYMLLLASIGLAVIVLGAGVYEAGSILKSKSGDVRKAKVRIAVVEQKQTALRKAKADIKKYQALADIAKNIVPKDKDQAQTVLEITNLAAKSSVALGNISFPSSSLGDGKTV